MSGVDLLLRTALEYKRTHQVILYTLFENSDLPELLISTRRTKTTEWEPERQLFDLGFSGENSRVLIEIKMWSSLTDSQLQQQVSFLKANNYHAGYVLLGTSWFEFDESMLRDRTAGRGKKLGYDELLTALNHLLVVSGQPPDVYELALTYRNSLASQFTTLKGAAHSERGKDKLFYYSIFWLLKERLPELSTAIYTVNNRGGPVYIFNNQLWHPLQVHGVSTHLYYEVVNDQLCIKFYAEIQDSSTKLQIRDSIRRAARAILDGQYKVIDSGHLGAYMTACRIEHDFSRVTDLEISASVFPGVDCALRAVADELSSIAC